MGYEKNFNLLIFDTEISTCVKEKVENNEGELCGKIFLADLFPR